MRAMDEVPKPPRPPRDLIVLYQCWNRTHHLREGTWVRCPVLQPRPYGECWACRHEGEPAWTYPEPV